VTEDEAKDISALPGGSLKSKPTWTTALTRFLSTAAFFVFRHRKHGGRTIPMTQPFSMAQQIAHAAIAFEEQRLGRRPTSVTVVLSADTLVITMHGVLSPAEKALAASPAGAAKLQEFHQQLFQLSSDPLRREIKRITGLELCEIAKDEATAAVQVFSVGTVVQVFLLAGRLPADSWDGT
jgi:uncharacterized protein YbcI